MKLTLKRAPFEKILTTLSEVIPSQTADANLKNFLIDVSEDGFKILGSDGTLSIETFISNKGDSIIINLNPGSVQIPASLFLSAIKRLSNEIVSLELVDESLLYLTDELTQYQLKVIPANEYPNISMECSLDESITIKMSDFERLYQTTYFAVANKGPKELFCGINISAKNDKLTFVATDSYRLARKYIDLDKEHYFSITVPSKALTLVSHITSYQEVSMYLDTNKVLFKVGPYTVSSKLIPGEFPNIDKIIPTNITYKLDVNSKEFIQAVDNITIVGNSRIQVTCGPDIIQLASKDQNVGSSMMPLKDAHFEGDDRFSIIFKSNFAIDAIKALDSERVCLEFVSDSRAFLITSEDKSITQVITPIRTLSE